MHQVDLTLSLDEITKIEGAATLDLKIVNSEVIECRFAIAEFKRFYTQAIRNKPVTAVPQLVARICGTCSNAHLLCNIKALEQALGISPSPQTKLLQQLLTYGLMIRDHALHLYVFVLPDIYNRDSILAFDENNPEEHQLLDDCFSVKSIGNALAICAGGRSVHAPFVGLAGFLKIPTKEQLTALVPTLIQARQKIQKLIAIFEKSSFALSLDTGYAALNDPTFSFLDGPIITSFGETIAPDAFASYLKHTVIPYSQASAYTWNGNTYMVGALARLNLLKDNLHTNTKRDAQKALTHFPSSNIFHNNLAQAIEILHSIDTSIDLIHSYEAAPETPPAIPTPTHQVIGVGAIEAPRGLLFHKMTVSENNRIANAQIVVPTGQNHIVIEQSIKAYVKKNLEKSKDELTHGIEQVIRAYDPCMSCATHFLKVNWK